MNPLKNSLDCFNQTIYQLQKDKEGWKALLGTAHRRQPDLQQSVNEFDMLYKDAQAARVKLLSVLATHWEDKVFDADGVQLTFKVAAGGKASWVHEAVDPGLKVRSE